MKYKHHIAGKRIYLRDVLLSDVNADYCRWLNDPEVNRYLEIRFTPQTPKAVRAYVKKMAADKNNVFLAIVTAEDDRHIGNIKIGPINPMHRFADVGIIIGEKSCWGKGYATEAIALATRYAFDALGLHRLEAGAYADNVGSAKAFLNAGWKTDGRERSKWLVDGHYTDGVRVSCVAPSKKSTERKNG